MSPRRPTSATAELAASNERELRAELAQVPGVCVLTGGQTGVDTAAALAALGVGLPVHLVFPRGLRQEDGPITPARRRALHGAVLHELSCAEFSHRTWTCVLLSDVVILIDPAGGDGCQETVRAAGGLGKPLLSLAAGPGPAPTPGQEAADRERAEQIGSFLIHNKARVLMIAGCRASLLAAAGCQSLVDARVSAIAVAARRRADALIADARHQGTKAP